MTKKHKLLLWIAEDPGGKTYTDCQVYIASLNGLDWNEREKQVLHTHEKTRTVSRRRHRGIWGNQVLSTLLREFCTQDPSTRRWRANFLVDSENQIVTLDGRVHARGLKPRTPRAPRLRLGVGYTLDPGMFHKLPGMSVPNQAKVILFTLNGVLSKTEPVISETDLCALLSDGRLKTSEHPWDVFRRYRRTLTKWGILVRVVMDPIFEMYRESHKGGKEKSC